MELISLKFGLFLLGLLAAYYLTGRFAQRFQWVVLLFGSMVFYGVAGSWPTISFMMLVALVTWEAALLLDKLGHEAKQARKQTKDRTERKRIRQVFDRKRRVVFWGALALCLVVLGYFKYWNVLLFYAGAADSIFSLGILLPLGISFYTFQSLGYLIDSYNAKYEPERNYARYLLFVSWFPQIIQGPINRYNEMAPQLFEPRHFDPASFERGALRLGYGILKKVAIANVLFNAVEIAFETGAGAAIPGSLALYGVITYSIQMYADFSGGIDIVEGASELFGIRMADNFKQPYFAVSLADFWRRWHISLGTWMRDYVFYPLAVTAPMKRFGKWSRKHFSRHVGRTLPACISNVLVFLFVGLWHGAQIHYVVWGIYNGVVVALADLFKPVFDGLVNRLRIRRESAGFRLFSMARTFCVVCIGRFFDRFDRLGDALHALHNVFVPSTYQPIHDVLAVKVAWHADVMGYPLPTIAAIVFVFVVDIFYERGHDVRSSVLDMKLPVRALIYLVAILLVAAAASLDTTNGGGGFLYANF